MKAVRQPSRAATFLAGTVLLCSVTTAAFAEDASDETHPALSPDAGWTRWVAGGSAALFIAAMIVGPMVLSRHPEVVADATSHEEDPAVDHHPGRATNGS